MNKTVAQVLKEYKNRQDNPEYDVIAINDIANTYNDVTNLKTYSENGFYWAEFDTKSRSNNEIRHIKIVGHVVRFEEFVQEIKNEEICQGCNKPISECTGQFRLCRGKQFKKICKECDNIKSVYDITLCKDCSSSY